VPNFSFAKYSQYWWSNRFYAILARRYGKRGARLPGVWAGISNRDFAVWPQELEMTLSVTGMKLFIVNPQDVDTVEALKLLYPQGVFSKYKSATGIEGKDIMIFFVPPQ